MRVRICLSFIALMSAGLVEAQETVKVISARWFEGSHSVDVTGTVAAACDGKTSCQRVTNDLGFPLPSQNHVIKNLSVTYSCGTQTITVSGREYIAFRLSCPQSPQPHALVDYRIDVPQSCDSSGDSRSLTLPDGYRFCWHYEFPFSQAGNSSATVSMLSNGIKVDWHVAPSGFPCPTFGRGWMEKVFIVSGARAGEDCPAHL